MPRVERSAWLLGAAALFAVVPAHANGRYPLSNQLVVSPKDPSHIAVRATFGLVLSADQGMSWSWVCEKAAQFVNGEDPPIELTADNSVIVTSSAAFTTSSDFGCSWALPEDGQVVVDADVDRSQPNRVVSVTTLFADDKYSFALRESLDNGATWKPLGVSAEGYVTTVAVAPSQPQRVYVTTTSLTTSTPSVLRSDDAGQTWHPFVLPAADSPVPYIAAVDPMNADRVYVRAPSSAGGDVLLVSENAGTSWKQLLKAKGTLAGFALSPDGTQLAVGGPTDGVQVASTSDYQLTGVNSLGVTCLTWTSAGIFACADQAKAGFSVGVSTDDGANFEPLFQSNKLTLKTCDAGSPVADACPNAWRGLAPLIGADPATPGYGGSSSTGGGSGTGAAGTGGLNGGAPTSDAGTSTGTSGSASSGGTAGGGTSGNTLAGSGGTASVPASTNSGCSLAAPKRSTFLSWVVLALGFAWSVRNRRAKLGRK